MALSGVTGTACGTSSFPFACVSVERPLSEASFFEGRFLNSFSDGIELWEEREMVKQQDPPGLFG